MMIVVVKKNIKPGIYQKVNFVPNMKYLCGKAIRIKPYKENIYITYDDATWFLTEPMFYRTVELK